MHSRTAVSYHLGPCSVLPRPHVELEWHKGPPKFRYRAIPILVQRLGALKEVEIGAGAVGVTNRLRLRSKVLCNSDRQLRCEVFETQSAVHEELCVKCS